MGEVGEGKFPKIVGDERELRNDITSRQNKILMNNNQHQNDSTIMPDSHVEYLRNSILGQMLNLLPNPFKYVVVCSSH